MFFMMVMQHGCSDWEVICAAWNALAPSFIPFTNVGHLRKFHSQLMKQQLLLASRVDVLKIMHKPQSHLTLDKCVAPVMSYTEAECFCHLVPVFGRSWQAMAAFWNVCVEELCNVVAASPEKKLSVCMYYKSAAELQSYHNKLATGTAVSTLQMLTDAQVHAPLQESESRATSAAFQRTVAAVSRPSSVRALPKGQLTLAAFTGWHASATTVAFPPTSSAPAIPTPSTASAAPIAPSNVHPSSIPSTSAAAAAGMPAATSVPASKSAAPTVGRKRKLPPDANAQQRKKPGPRKGSLQKKKTCTLCKEQLGVTSGGQVQHAWQNCPLRCPTCSTKGLVRADQCECNLQQQPAAASHT
jgi:hypothetical protein